MATVTYKNQPGIKKTKGAIPLAGTRHACTVNKVLWPEDVSRLLADTLIHKSLHVCCGKSPLGDIRLDSDASNNPAVVADAAKLPFAGVFDALND